MKAYNGKNNYFKMKLKRMLVHVHQNIVLLFMRSAHDCITVHNVVEYVPDGKLLWSSSIRLD